MTNKHTPGPWDCSGEFIVAPDPSDEHPDIYITTIADLLEALRSVLETWENDPEQSNIILTDRIRAALAKAGAK